MKYIKIIIFISGIFTQNPKIDDETLEKLKKPIRESINNVVKQMNDTLTQLEEQAGQAIDGFSTSPYQNI